MGGELLERAKGHQLGLSGDDCRQTRHRPRERWSATLFIFSLILCSLVKDCLLNMVTGFYFLLRVNVAALRVYGEGRGK